MQPASGSDPGVTACGFDTSQSFGQVLVTLHRPGQDAFDRAREARATDPTSFAEIDGLGQQAFATHEGADVLVNDSFITVSAQNETPGFGSKAVILARFAVSRAA
jgi:hypothetical protein